jgi:hypothetical protein
MGREEEVHIAESTSVEKPVSVDNWTEKDVAHADEFQVKVRVSGTSVILLEGNVGVGV